MNQTPLDPNQTFFSAAKEKTKTLGFKAVLIVLLLLVFLIPLGFVRSIVFDRQGFKADAVSSVLNPAGGEFSLNGLSLLIEYYEPYEVTEKLENGQVKTLRRQRRNLMVLSPSAYEVAAQTATSLLTRGIFSVPTYKGNLLLKARFDIPANQYFIYDSDGLLENNAFLSLSLANNKTLLEFPLLKSGQTTLARKETKIDISDLYMNDIQFDARGVISRNSAFELEGNLVFQGGNALHFAPLAGDSVFTLVSDWATPSFSGGWLPVERSVTGEGFEARWQIAGISTGIDPVAHYEMLGAKPRSEYFEYSDSDKVSAFFFIPVESYHKTERSIKYALLFLLVPFLTIFLLEIFVKIRIHPIQYCLIGLANVVFYLLLLSVSEHLSFNVSYLLSAFAVTALTAAYAGSILRSQRLSLMIALVQSISYVFLFGALQAEDYALLIGSLGLFAIVAVLMFITRKIDWYGGEL